VRTLRLRWTLLCLTVVLAACGGGSSSSPDPEPAPPTISVSDANVDEGDTGAVTLSFIVSLSRSTDVTVSVDYATSDGSAIAGQDYDAQSGTLSIPSGSLQGQVDIVVSGDIDIEGNESLTLTLSSPVNATLSRATATGVIVDNESSGGTFGLNVRPDNLTCVAPMRPIVDASIDLQDAYPSLPSILLPTKLLLEPVADPRWFVLSKNGEVLTFDPDNATSLTTYLDLNNGRSIRTRSEGGLLGIAFHPDYPATPEIFLSYTIDHTGPAMRSVISRFVLDDVVSPGAGTVEQVIIEIDQDFDNHNGGDIGFGPDGYLYIGLGDGGSGNDPFRRSQDTTRLLGSMLRIDVNGTGAGYDIPADNPFAANTRCGPGDNAASCPEIYAWGLRNPWRWSFDADSGALWLADVGQGAFEEVNVITRGGNYGWHCREGSSDTGSAADCLAGTLIDPVTEYGRSLGSSITGGYVYRGTELPDLVGQYVFADFGSGRFFAAAPDGAGGFVNDELVDSNLSPTAFGIGPDEELYVVDIGGSGTGRVRRLVQAGPPSADTIPELLSQTGCTDPGDITAPYNGLLPYALNAPFWSDNAAKDRFIGLPNGTTIARGADGDWMFPAGTVIVKNFRLNNRLVETRHLMRHPDGVWAGYTYEWNAAQTEATRVRGGKVVNVEGQTWIYPSEAQCLACHTEAAGYALGPEDAQLNRTFTYPGTGIAANQLETIDHVMMFSAPLPGPADTLDQLADPNDTSASLDDRARAYLHTNCASCHRPNGPAPTALDLRYGVDLVDTNACEVVPLQGDLGIANARLIAPGAPDRSLIVVRSERRDSVAMPPIGSAIVDTAGVNLVRDWISSLSGCN